MRSVLVLGFLGGFVGLTASPSALACSCAAGPLSSAPRDGAAEVPLNTRIVASFVYAEPNDYDTILLNLNSGEEVSTSRSDLSQGSSFLRTLTPDEPLAPNTSYAIQTTQDPVEEDEEPTQFSWTFSTGDWSDDAPPTGGEILDLTTEKTGSSNECGESLQLHMQLNAGLDGGGDVVYEVEVAEGSDFSNSDVYTFFQPGGQLGWGACLDNRPDLSKGETLWLRSRAVDVAGNREEWKGLGFQQRIGGCTSVAMTAPGLGLIWGMLTLLVATQRRRRLGQVAP